MPRTDDHHDNRYEDGEPLPATDWDFDPSEADLNVLYEVWDNRDKTLPPPGVFDLRGALGRAPTVQEYRESRGL